VYSSIDRIETATNEYLRRSIHKKIRNRRIKIENRQYIFQKIILNSGQLNLISYKDEIYFAVGHFL
jgi:hypothetical protein